jgi:hypothetical protein
MTSKSTSPSPRVTVEYEVVWSGATVSPWGERGSLLPPTHAVGSTWQACADVIRSATDAADRRPRA